MHFQFALSNLLFQKMKTCTLHAQISCGFIYAVSLLYKTISTKAHHSSLIINFQVKIRALEDRECNRYQYLTLNSAESVCGLKNKTYMN